MFGSGAAGLLLYLAHVAASLLVGVLFRFYRYREPPRPSRQPEAPARSQRRTTAFSSWMMKFR